MLQYGHLHLLHYLQVEMLLKYDFLLFCYYLKEHYDL